jgi:hypothetical protein
MVFLLKLKIVQGNSPFGYIYMKEKIKETIKEILFFILIFIISFFLGWTILIIIYPLISPIIESGTDFPFYDLMNAVIVNFGLTLIIFFFIINLRRWLNKLKKSYPTIYVLSLILLVLVLIVLLIALMKRTEMLSSGFSFFVFCTAKRK